MTQFCGEHSEFARSLGSLDAKMGNVQEDVRGMLGSISNIEKNMSFWNGRRVGIIGVGGALLGVAGLVVAIVK